MLLGPFYRKLAYVACTGFGAVLMGARLMRQYTSLIDKLRNNATEGKKVTSLLKKNNY